MNEKFADEFFKNRKKSKALNMLNSSRDSSELLAGKKNSMGQMACCDYFIRSFDFSSSASATVLIEDCFEAEFEVDPLFF